MRIVDNAGPDQADQDLRCPFTESMDTVVYRKCPDQTT